VVRLYHATTPEAAIKILWEGFDDGPRQTALNVGGVWLASTPSDENEGAKGGTRVAVEVPAETAESWRLIEGEETYLAPAADVNQWTRVVLCDGCGSVAEEPCVEEIRGRLYVVCAMCGGGS